jgi:hypothetical protein
VDLVGADGVQRIKFEHGIVKPGETILPPRREFASHALYVLAHAEGIAAADRVTTMSQSASRTTDPNGLVQEPEPHHRPEGSSPSLFGNLPG